MKFPSVTKILDVTMPAEKRAGLEAWRSRIGDEEAKKVLELAILRGKNIDSQVEEFRSNGTCEDARIKEYLTGYRILELEFVIVSEIYKYQGRLDAILQMNGRNILVDFKGSNKWKPNKYLQDYRLQIGAYFGALSEMSYNIDAACVVIFVDGMDKPQLLWQQPSDLWDAHAEFVKRVAMYESMCGRPI